jgi:hypothetical protein
MQVVLIELALIDGSIGKIELSLKITGYNLPIPVFFLPRNFPHTRFCPARPRRRSRAACHFSSRRRILRRSSGNRCRFPRPYRRPSRPRKTRSLSELTSRSRWPCRFSTPPCTASHQPIFRCLRINLIALPKPSLFPLNHSPS